MSVDCGDVELRVGKGGVVAIFRYSYDEITGDHEFRFYITPRGVSFESSDWDKVKSILRELYQVARELKRRDRHLHSILKRTRGLDGRAIQDELALRYIILLTYLDHAIDEVRILKRMLARSFKRALIIKRNLPYVLSILNSALELCRRCGTCTDTSQQ